MSIQVWLPRLQNEPLCAEVVTDEIRFGKQPEVLKQKRCRVTLPSKETVDVY